jgi:hypothetical protein
VRRRERLRSLGQGVGLRVGLLFGLLRRMLGWPLCCRAGMSRLQEMAGLTRRMLMERRSP